MSIEIPAKALGKMIWHSIVGAPFPWMENQLSQEFCKIDKKLSFQNGKN
jgi:hypothetical protein